ncbi:MAG TPA: histidine phosphatase family protein [Nocardioides sp.]|uniref:histidine phosphatase family protein n=1 Tax=Nocardioides sp. TaxID=35761 RepID=UPI002F4297BD
MPRVLYLVRHGRPVVDPSRPAHEWELDPAYADDVRVLRRRLPAHADWFSSPEPKAIGTARLLTDGPVEVVADLREHERLTADWIDDFETVVRRAFDHPDHPAYDGWAALADTRRRVVSAVAGILDQHRRRDVVLVGHGTAWTLLRSALLGEPPDLDWWARLAMPDVVHYPVPHDPGDMLEP